MPVGLVPVEHDPFNGETGAFSLLPVEHNPWDIGASLPEGYADPSVGVGALIKNALTGMVTLPRRAIENSQESLNSGNYDPSVPVEAAMTVMGGGIGGTGEGAGAALGSGPLRKAALPMDDASRLERMLSQGYVPNGERLYHETSGANIPGIEASGFDVNKIGARAGDEQMPNGVFLKRHGENIGVGGENSAQIPLLAPIGTQLKEFPSREALSAHLSRDKEYSDIADELKVANQEYKAKSDALEKQAYGGPRGDTPDKLKAQKDWEIHIDDWDRKVNDLAAQARERSTKLLKEQGYDGIRVWNDAGSFGRKVDTTVIFDPAKLRSPLAAFDPSQIGSKNLMAGIAGASALPLGVHLIPVDHDPFAQ